ncbi:MAG TPA: diacylglycerol kinase family lipid kinase [Clostridiales bacterium]|nr:diacylglycerol kinase family lipid kinase [Clostridiales bacterium]
MKHLFIINPIAGKGKALEYIPKIEEYFSRMKDLFFIEVTKYPGHAIELVKQYVDKETYRVYSVGGDGTLNEVLNGMAGSDSSLAIIPAGSGNDFIKSIRNYSVDKESPEKNIMKITSKVSLLERLVKGTESFIDIGKINNRYFINISSLGFDAEVVYKSHKIKKLPLITGLLAYVLSVFATLVSYQSNPLKIKIDGQTIEKGTLLVAVANGRYYGGGMQAAPSAELNDGFLDICLIEYAKRLRILKLFPKFIKGQHAGIKEVSFHRGKNISIISKNKVAMNVDGETNIVEGKVDFEIIPNAVRIVLP